MNKFSRGIPLHFRLSGIVEIEIGEPIVVASVGCGG